MDNNLNESLVIYCNKILPFINDFYSNIEYLLALIIREIQTNDIVYISFEKDQLQKVELYSITGKLLFKNYLNTDSYALNINEYASGHYYLRVYKQNGDVVNSKIIKN